MGQQSKLFEAAINHAMLYEVGGFWNENAPGVREGLITTAQHRKNVGYTNDVNDNGGETKFGISKRANKDLDIARLTWEQAKGRYYTSYWVGSKSNLMEADSPRLALLHFDAAINHGVGKAALMLQEALGVVVDGNIGPQTLRAAAVADELSICKKYCDLRRQHYNNIVKNNPTQKKWINGWMRRVNEMESFVNKVKV